MKTLKCTWLGLDCNEHRVYWVLNKEYVVEKETKTQYKIKDEYGCLRTVSKAKMSLTGFSSDSFATCFDEV